MEQAALRPVDSADVTILVDTCVDVLLAGSEVARRAPLAYDWTGGDQLRAEHGYALLLTVQQGERRQSVLYDAVVYRPGRSSRPGPASATWPPRYGEHP
jgi:hypothetical protein